MRLTFLGTSAARPTVSRNVSSLVIQREGEVMMFDCGEGTQRQMMRYGTGFTLSQIYFSHLHADHFLGVIGLLRTLGLQGREEPVTLFGPAGATVILRQAVDLGVERVPFQVAIRELEPGEAVPHEGFSVIPFRTSHGGRSLGYALVEEERLGRFDAELARRLGVPEGPLWGRLHRGEAVEVEGRTITAAAVVGPPRPGRKVAYTGDTRPSRFVVEAVRGADVLVHEATFAADEAARARDTGHSTAREAARVAREAGVLQLLLTHISPRYADDPRLLEREARRLFPAASIAHDGLVVEVPFRDGSES